MKNNNLKKLGQLLAFVLITCFLSGCVGIDSDAPGFFIGASIIGVIMIFISIIRMLFVGFKGEELNFFAIGAVLLLIG